MSWIAPKINWASNDAIGYVDLNRIEGNASALDAKIDAQIATVVPYSEFKNHIRISGFLYPTNGDEIDVSTAAILQSLTIKIPNNGTLTLKHVRCAGFGNCRIRINLVGADVSEIYTATEGDVDTQDYPEYSGKLLGSNTSGSTQIKTLLVQAYVPGDKPVSRPDIGAGWEIAIQLVY
jgi:hypothetical protein